MCQFLSWTPQNGFGVPFGVPSKPQNQLVSSLGKPTGDKPFGVLHFAVDMVQFPMSIFKLAFHQVWTSRYGGLCNASLLRASLYKHITSMSPKPIPENAVQMCGPVNFYVFPFKASKLGSHFGEEHPQGPTRVKRETLGSSEDSKNVLVLTP